MNSGPSGATGGMSTGTSVTSSAMGGSKDAAEV